MSRDIDDFDDDINYEPEVPEGYEVYVSIEDYANTEELEDLSYYDMDFDISDDEEVRDFLANLGTGYDVDEYD